MRARVLLVLIAAVTCSNGKGPSEVSTMPDAGNGSDAGDEPDGGCRRNPDCASGATCVPPEEPQCQDAGAPQGCNDDADCASSSAGDLCEQSPCGIRVCVPRCGTDADCISKGAGLACELTSGRCVAKPCDQATDCPTNYLCSVDHACVVKPCLSDSECEGFCVRSTCSSSLGVCR